MNVLMWSLNPILEVSGLHPEVCSDYKVYPCKTQVVHDYARVIQRQVQVAPCQDQWGPRCPKSSASHHCKLVVKFKWSLFHDVMMSQVGQQFRAYTPLKLLLELEVKLKTCIVLLI